MTYCDTDEEENSFPSIFIISLFCLVVTLLVIDASDGYEWVCGWGILTQVFQPKPGTGDLAIKSAKPEFLATISTKAWSGWPCHRGLQSLSFGRFRCFEQSLERVTLPSGLQRFGAVCWGLAIYRAMFLSVVQAVLNLFDTSLNRYSKQKRRAFPNWGWQSLGAGGDTNLPFCSHSVSECGILIIGNYYWKSWG